MSYIIQTKYTNSGQCRLDKIQHNLKDCYIAFNTEDALTYLVEKSWLLKNCSNILNISVVGDKIYHKKHISECVLSYWNYYSGDNQGKNTISRVLREYELESLQGLKKCGYDSVIIYDAVVGMTKKKIIDREILVFDESKIHIVTDTQDVCNLLICYHNTNSDFKKFDKSFIGSGYGTSYGNGFYFSSEPIQEYGKTITVTLDIKKPYKIENVRSFDEVLKYIMACM